MNIGDVKIPDFHKTPWQQVVAGRGLDEQIEWIREQGGHGAVPMLREFVLRGVGIPQPRETADNLIVLGCYLSFLTPRLLLEYMKILDHLGIDYTYLQNELCCGLPMVFTTEGEEREKAMQAAKEFMETNRDAAQQKGAKTIAYFCTWCAYLAKAFFPDDAVSHAYSPDLIIDKSEKEIMRVTPTVMGYYEGCHTRNRFYAPRVNLDWGRYRQLLDRIDGLTIVDLPHTTCCQESPERIVEEAEKNNLDTVLCSCTGCYNAVGAVAGGRVQMKFFPEVLLQALRRE